MLRTDQEYPRGHGYRHRVGEDTREKRTLRYGLPRFVVFIMCEAGAAVVASGIVK